MKTGHSFGEIALDQGKISEYKESVVSLIRTGLVILDRKTFIKQLKRLRKKQANERQEVIMR